MRSLSYEIKKIMKYHDLFKLHDSPPISLRLVCTTFSLYHRIFFSGDSTGQLGCNKIIKKNTKSSAVLKKTPIFLLKIVYILSAFYITIVSEREERK